MIHAPPECRSYAFSIHTEYPPNEESFAALAAEGAVYFVTFRLADAVPKPLLAQWENDREAWLRVHPEPWNNEIEREYHQRFSGVIERWLDVGHGACRCGVANVRRSSWKR